MGKRSSQDLEARQRLVRATADYIEVARAQERYDQVAREYLAAWEAVHGRDGEPEAA